jgi:Rod binding domain-containing protein
MDISALSSATDPTLLATKLDPTASLSMKLAGAGASDARIEKTAIDFEAMFATEMLRPMFEGVEVDQMFGGGHGEEIMRSFMVQEYGKVIAKTDKLGIAKQVKAEMIRMQDGGKTNKNDASAATATRAYRNAPGLRSLKDREDLYVAVQ